MLNASEHFAHAPATQMLLYVYKDTTIDAIPPEACALKYACQACIVKALWRRASTARVHSRGTKWECIPARPPGRLQEASIAVARLFGLGLSR